MTRDRGSFLSNQRLQLFRLERLMDVVFALVIWHVATLLPKPEVEIGESGSILELFQESFGPENGSLLFDHPFNLLVLFAAAEVRIYSRIGTCTPTEVAPIIVSELMRVNSVNKRNETPWLRHIVNERCLVLIGLTRV